MNTKQAEEIVDAFYRGFLRREPDDRSREHFVRSLCSGLSVTSLVEQFLASSEFSAVREEKGLWVPAGHFYSPIVDPEQGAEFLDRLDQFPESLPGLKIEREALRDTWNQMLPVFRDMPFQGGPKDGYRYCFENHSYSWGDGSVLHAMIRILKPETIVEIGSGHSSACTLDTVDRYLAGQCGVYFIEPYPDLLHSVMGVLPANVHIIPDQVQKTPIEMFTRLRANDILFIDSTHVMKAGSDVCFELFEILPRIASGVVVHFHDIFWPFEYPRSWVVDDNRSWNELYGLRAFLTSNDEWELVFFNDYFAKFDRKIIERDYPEFLNNTGGAFWIRKR